MGWNKYHMDNSIIEITQRLDRLIELVENMGKDESKIIKSELKKLSDWKISFETAQKTRASLLQIFRWTAPWILAFLFVLFQHKIKI